jgi:hypothetical protein
LPRRNSREPITIKIKARGGAECWVEIEGRGETNRYPGYTAIWDILRDINQEG